MYYDTDSIKKIKSDEPIEIISKNMQGALYDLRRGGFCKTHYTPEEIKRMLNKIYGGII